MIDMCPVSADLRPNTPSLSLPVDLPSPAGGRGVAWPRESSQPKLFPEATNQFQVGSRRAEQVQQPRPRHQLTSYPGRCGGAARPATGWCGAALEISVWRDLLIIQRRYCSSRIFKRINSFVKKIFRKYYSPLTSNYLRHYN